MNNIEDPQARINLAVEYVAALTRYMAANLNALTVLTKEMAETLDQVSGLIREMETKDDSSALTPD